MAARKDKIAQQCPRKRYRLDPDYLPEIAAYLIMIGKRYQRAAIGLEAAGLQSVKNAAAHAFNENAVAALQAVINGLPDKFPSSEWLQALADVGADMGIQIEPQTGEGVDE